MGHSTGTRERNSIRQCKLQLGQPRTPHPSVRDTALARVVELTGTSPMQSAPRPGARHTSTSSKYPHSHHGRAQPAEYSQVLDANSRPALFPTLPESHGSAREHSPRSILGKQASGRCRADVTMERCHPTTTQLKAPRSGIASEKQSEQPGVNASTPDRHSFSPAQTWARQDTHRQPMAMPQPPAAMYCPASPGGSSSCQADWR